MDLRAGSLASGSSGGLLHDASPPGPKPKEQDMCPRPSHTDRNRVREGLSFAFPMQLPPAGTGAGSCQVHPKAQSHKSHQEAAKRR